jgi:hypothetical protein
MTKLFVSIPFANENVVVIRAASGQGKTTLAYRYILDFAPQDFRFEALRAANLDVRRAGLLREVHSSFESYLGIPLMSWVPRNQKTQPQSRRTNSASDRYSRLFSHENETLGDILLYLEKVIVSHRHCDEHSPARHVGRSQRGRTDSGGDGKTEQDG